MNTIKAERIDAQGNATLFVWRNVKWGDECEPVKVMSSQRSAQITGDFDGAEVEMQASLDGVAYESAKQGTLYARTNAPAVMNLDTFAQFYKPAIFAAMQKTDLTITLLVRS